MTAEVGIRLTEMTVEQKLDQITLQTEPACWRYFSNLGGTISTLRPDLFVITTLSSSDYDDHWFFEVDLATESPAMVIRKCEQYLAYMRSGIEQKTHGVFPRVVWLTPSLKRKTSLERHIAQRLPNTGQLFAVISFDELGVSFSRGSRHE